MPIYEYNCKKCAGVFEVLHRSINEKLEIACPNCGCSEVSKQMSRFSGKIGSSGSSSCSSCAATSCASCSS